MKYELKGISVEELAFKITHAKLEPNARLDIKPQFSRQVRKANDNKKLMFINLSVKVESTEEEPKPFDITASIVGFFETESEDYTEQEERDVVVNATQMLYPYLRSAVTNLTAQAYISPLNLPIINGPIFPEDRDVYTFRPGKVN